MIRSLNAVRKIKDTNVFAEKDIRAFLMIPETFVKMLTSVVWAAVEPKTLTAF